MDIIKLNATPRAEHGKGASRRLRRSDQIPAIAYGRELAATMIAVSPKALLSVLTSPHGQNSVVELDIEGGEKLTVMVRDYAYHPVSRSLLHADFMQVKLDQPVDVDVPFVCTGKAKGLVSGGVLQQIFRRIPIRALPEKIPLHVEVDVTELEMGDSLKASQIKLPEGVKVRLPDDQTVVVVAAPEKVTEEETKAAGAPGAPAAGAPAAGAAAPRPLLLPRRRGQGRRQGRRCPGEGRGSGQGRQEEVTPARMLLVVGLGNPGREYAAHRHNVGFMAVDELARRTGADAFRDRFSGVCARAEIAGEPAILLKPMTFMNDSGRSVQPAMAFFKVAPRELVLIHDELDIPFGDVRIKFGGGHAGHNGLRSIMAAVSTGDFGRLRLGIGRPPQDFRGDVASFVLSGFSAEERASLPELLEKAGDTVLDIVRRGFDAAMKARNTRPKAPRKPAPPDGRAGDEGEGGAST